MTSDPTASRDDATTVAELKQIVARFVDERDWQQFHNPKNLSMSLAIEAAELMEHFQWSTPDQAGQMVNNPEQLRAIGEEVADCLAYLLAMSQVLGLDLSTALREKMQKNVKKYPLETSRGVARPNPQAGKRS